MDENIELIMWGAFGVMAVVLWFLTTGIERWAFAGAILLAGIIIIFIIGDLILSSFIGIIYGMISAAFFAYFVTNYFENSVWGGIVAIAVFVFVIIWAGLTEIYEK